MKILLVGSTMKDDNTYGAVQLNFLKQRLGNYRDVEVYGVKIKKHEDDKDDPRYYKMLLDEIAKFDLPNFDFIIGVGDSYFSNLHNARGFTKELILSAFGSGDLSQWNKRPLFIEFNNQPQVSNDVPDYVFHHLDVPTDDPRFLHVGHGVDLNDLCPPESIENNDTRKLRIYIDHRMPNRNDQTDSILNLMNNPFTNMMFDVFHHSNMGIVQNQFEESHRSKISKTYKKYPREEMYELYKSMDIYIPTHRETLGYTAIELAACGALIVANPNMFPASIFPKLPVYAYNNFEDINWEYVIKSARGMYNKKQRHDKIKTQFAHWHYTNSIVEKLHEAKERFNAV